MIIWKEKYQYCIIEKKNAVGVQPVVQSVPKKQLVWSRMKKDLNIHILKNVNVCGVINVSRYAQSRRRKGWRNCVCYSPDFVL